MPLLFQASIVPPGEWGLWRIDEPESQLREEVDLYAEEQSQLDSIRGENKRREFLAARLLLHRMSGRAERAELSKDQDGKPHLQDSSFFVSISHTTGYAAAIAHPNRCGIDVQRIVARIRTLAPKFVNTAERRALTKKCELIDLHLIWSAKEAIYKAYGRRQLDFRRDMTVHLEDRMAILDTGRLRMDFGLNLRRYEHFVLVAAVAC